MYRAVLASSAFADHPLHGETHPVQKCLVCQRAGARRTRTAVCLCMCARVCTCASPPSREHGAVERMRNVGVEEVREGGPGGQSGELVLECERG